MTFGNIRAYTLVANSRQSNLLHIKLSESAVRLRFEGFTNFYKPSDSHFFA